MNNKYKYRVSTINQCKDTDSILLLDAPYAFSIEDYNGICSFAKNVLENQKESNLLGIEEEDWLIAKEVLKNYPPETFCVIRELK